MVEFQLGSIRERRGEESWGVCVAEEAPRRAARTSHPPLKLALDAVGGGPGPERGGCGSSSMMPDLASPRMPCTPDIKMKWMKEGGVVDLPSWNDRGGGRQGGTRLGLIRGGRHGPSMFMVD